LAYPARSAYARFLVFSARAGADRERKQGVELTRAQLLREWLPLLFAKLQEEVQEFQTDRSAEELADVVEVLRAIQMEVGVSDKRLEACRSRKAADHGAFRAGIVLSLNAT
jgi:predicted house-cleaning noncanonical NTP pyrophosphatase (MazG superfamily)